MFHFSKFNNGRYLEIGSIFHKSLEIGYQFHDSTGYDLNFSISSQDHGAISFSLCLGRFFFEINIFDCRQFSYGFGGYSLNEDDDEEEIAAISSPLALPEITMSSILGVKKDTKEDDEIEETYPIPDMCYSAGTPEDVGPITPRVDLPIQPRQGLSFAEKEFEEHGSIALRHWVGMEHPTDNTIDASYKLVCGASIILRAKEGGFHFPRLQYDNGWYVIIETGYRRIDVVFDDKRGLWVIKELV